MSIGASIFLIAVGAILRYAVTAQIADVDIQTVGLILMIAGGVGLLITLFLYAQRSRTEPPDGPPPPDRDPRYPDEPPRY